MKTRHFSKRHLALCAATSAILAFGASPMIAEAAQSAAPKLLAPNAVGEGAESIPDLVERVSPSVVSVLVEREVERPAMPDAFSEFFQFRFGQPYGGQGAPNGQNDDGFGEGGVERMEAQGSGFFIDAAGHVVTNHHVTEGADAIRIRLADGTELDAELVGEDELTDIAVLKVTSPKGQPFVKFADNVNLRVGETVVAIGNPFGLGGTVTSGIVSAIGGQNRQGQFLDFIQIDAPINRGNSGGPTFDMKGRVVGVNRAIYSPNGGSVGIGFAIPAKVAKSTVDQLIERGKVTRGWLGVELRGLDTALAAALGRNDTNGALVNNVLDGTPAANAGLEPGDLILKVNNKAITDTTDLSRTVASYPPGEKVKVAVLRNGAQKNITVTLGQRDAEEALTEAPAANDNADDRMASLGLRLGELDDAARARFRIAEDVADGVVVTGVQRGSHAAEAGLRTGVVILEVDGEKIASVAQLKKKVDAARESGKEAIFMRVQLGATKQFTALELNKNEG